MMAARRERRGSGKIGWVLHKYQHERKGGSLLNVLFLTLSAIEDINERGIYTDLVRELSARGVNVSVVTPRQKRENLPTELTRQDNIHLLRVKTGNITSTKSLIEKGISTILIQYQYMRAIREHFKNTHFEMVLYSTPPITFNKIAHYFKTTQNSKTYLMLKDIFPQNAVDIGILRKGSLLWKYFRRKEIELYKVSDVIGCMSKANVEYLLQHNDFIEKDRVEIFPNAIEPMEYVEKKEKNIEVLKKYGIPMDLTLFIYGGNLGRPQGIDFLLEVVDNFYKIEGGYLLIIGSGTEYSKVEKYIKERRPPNVSLLQKLPKEEYDKLATSADVGLIFLDRRFTIPNFPSRLTSYMENSLPILAATDKNTDLKDVIVESKCGFWCESGDINSFVHYAQDLAKNEGLRSEMGLNGRIYLERNYDITKTIEILLKHLHGDERDVQR